MDTRFSPHNAHLDGGLRAFIQNDPHLKRLKSQIFKYIHPLLKILPTHQPGIYSITGGRQIGKTTLLKQWMAELLKKGGAPDQIAFLTGELINDQHSLVQILQNLKSKIILLDEVTYIKDWDKGIKFLADAGFLEKTILILTGSDSSIIQETRMRFPGRRGKANQVDYHLFPLSFAEAVRLKRKTKTPSIDVLFDEFSSYLLHGGFLTAMNELEMTRIISVATLTTYSDWIRGDMQKRGKHEHSLREIIEAIFKTYGRQISWNMLAQNLSINHPKTVADYIELLAAFDITFIQSALLEHKLRAAPKKAKKLGFNDPFIYHALRHWINPCKEPYRDQILPLLKNTEACGSIVESVVVAHFKRLAPTYYIKAEGEVDVAVVRDHRFWPIEVKWTDQLRANELKQIFKYKNGKIWASVREGFDMKSVAVEPLPKALYGLG